MYAPVRTKLFTDFTYWYNIFALFCSGGSNLMWYTNEGMGVAVQPFSNALICGMYPFLVRHAAIQKRVAPYVVGLSSQNYTQSHCVYPPYMAIWHYVGLGARDGNGRDYTVGTYSERASQLEVLSDTRFFRVAVAASSAVSVVLSVGVTGALVLAPGHSYRSTHEAFARNDIITATWATHLNAGRGDTIQFLPKTCRSSSLLPRTFTSFSISI